MSTRTISGRAAFYLQHQKRIEEWSALQKDVNSEAHAFFCSLTEPLEDAAQKLPGEPQLFVELELSPRLFLYREEWMRGRAGTFPLVAVGLEWPRKDVSFDSAYSGIWVPNKDNPLFGTLGPAIVERVEPILGPEKYTMKKTPTWWPASRHERPLQTSPEGTPYWEDLDTFAEVLVQRLCRLWESSWKEVHEAFIKTSVEVEPDNLHHTPPTLSASPHSP